MICTWIAIALFSIQLVIILILNYENNEQYDYIEKLENKLGMEVNNEK